MASIRAPVDVHRKTHINSDRLDEAVWFAVGYYVMVQVCWYKKKRFHQSAYRNSAKPKKRHFMLSPRKNTMQRLLNL